jgi:hypothetical protein
MNKRRFIGPVGTITRLLVGGSLIVLVVIDPEWWGGDSLLSRDALLGLAAFQAAILLLQWLRTLFTQQTLYATDHIGLCLNMTLAAALFVFSPTREAAALFYGASMLVAAARGYAGCEVLAISNWLLRRDDQVGCLFFSPLDAVEAKLSRQMFAKPSDEAAAR